MFTQKPIRSSIRDIITNGGAATSRLRNLVLLTFLVIAFALPGTLEAQTGGKKRERKAKRRGSLVLTQYKSRGHADEFARGSAGRKGIFARLFKKDRPAWQNRSTGSPRSNYKENKYLFSWNRSKGRGENAATIDRQKRERSRNREHGNATFKDKKHKRKKH